MTSQLFQESPIFAGLSKHMFAFGACLWRNNMNVDETCCWQLIWGSVFWGVEGHIWRANLTIITCMFNKSHISIHPSIHDQINNIPFIHLCPKGTFYFFFFSVPKTDKSPSGFWKCLQQSCPLNDPYDLCKMTSAQINLIRLRRHNITDITLKQTKTIINSANIT